MNKNKLSKDEFFRSMDVVKEHLKSAEILLNAGQYRDSISRSYYAFFDLVAALLASKGLIVKTHSGALQKLGLYFIKTGILPIDTGKSMIKLLEARQKADYEWKIDFSIKDAQEAYKDAEAFINLIEKLIDKIYLHKE